MSMTKEPEKKKERFIFKTTVDEIMGFNKRGNDKSENQEHLAEETRSATHEACISWQFFPVGTR